MGGYTQMYKCTAATTSRNGLEPLWMDASHQSPRAANCLQTNTRLPCSHCFLGAKAAVVQGQIPLLITFLKIAALLIRNDLHPAHTADMQPAKPQPRTLTPCKHTIYSGEIASGLRPLPLMFAREALFAKDVLMHLVTPMLNTG